MFKENVVEWYTPQVVLEVEDWDQDQYGNTWFSVKFEEDAGTHLWLAKNKPEEGKKYYGHFEKTKSGKALRFKTDKVPDDKPAPKEANEKQAVWGESPDKQAHISRSVALNNAVLFVKDNKTLPQVAGSVLTVAEEFLEWLNPEQTQEEKDISTLFSEKDRPDDMEQPNEN